MGACLESFFSPSLAVAFLWWSDLFLVRTIWLSFLLSQYVCLAEWDFVLRTSSPLFQCRAGGHILIGLIFLINIMSYLVHFLGVPLSFLVSIFFLNSISYTSNPAFSFLLWACKRVISNNHYTESIHCVEISHSKEFSPLFSTFALGKFLEYLQAAARLFNRIFHE